jgi:hypothetical protein
MSNQQVTQKEVADPNLRLFSNDEYRYKAYRWYCAKRIILKLGVILSGAITAVGSLMQLIESMLG